MNRDAPDGHVGEVFTAFLKLGLTCFGGPIAVWKAPPWIVVMLLAGAGLLSGLT